MNKNLSLIAAGLATVTLAGGVRADQTAPVMLMTEALGDPLSKTDWNKSLNFAKFDTSLGVLDAVCLTVDVDITSSGMVTNNAQSTETFKLQSNVSVDVTAPGYGPNTVTASASSPNITLNPTDSASYGPIGGTQSSGVINITTGLGAFEGSGTFAVSGSTLTGITILGGGGNVTASQTTFAKMAATVFYKYHTTQAVPEPGSVALLLAGGLSGAGFLLRRRK